MLVIFVLIYVWQNIEIIKIAMGFRTLAGSEKKLLVEKNKLLYGIERFTRQDRMKNIAESQKFRQVKKGDVTIITPGGNR